MTVNETFDHLYKSELENIQLDVIGGNITNRFLLPNGLCKVYVGKPNTSFDVNFTSNGEVTDYFIFVADPAVTTAFQLPYTLMKGDNMNLETVQNYTFKKYSNYNIQLKETSVKTGMNIYIFLLT